MAQDQQQDLYGDRFGGVGRVLGTQASARLRQSHIAVVGIGGVGSWTAEALARTGVGRITLIDLDDVCVTNTNRQVLALSNTVGRPKVEVMAERMQAIAPEIQVDVVSDFYTPANGDQLLSQGFDLVVDAIDAYRDKLDLIRRAKQARVPLVVVGGAGGRRDPSRIQRADLNRTHGDALLKRLRRDLRGEALFPRERAWGIPTIFTDEERRFPGSDGEPCAVASTNAGMDCGGGLGALTWVTATMGFWAASAAVEEVLRRAARTT